MRSVPQVNSANHTRYTSYTQRKAKSCHLNSDASSGRVGVAGAGGSNGASSISGDSRRLPLALSGLSAALTGLLCPTGLPPLLEGNAGGGTLPLLCAGAAWVAALAVGAGRAAAVASEPASATG